MTKILMLLKNATFCFIFLLQYIAFGLKCDPDIHPYIWELYIYTESVCVCESSQSQAPGPRVNVVEGNTAGLNGIIQRITFPNAPGCDYCTLQLGLTDSLYNVSSAPSEFWTNIQTYLSVIITTMDMSECTQTCAS